MLKESSYFEIDWVGMGIQHSFPKQKKEECPFKTGSLEKKQECPTLSDAPTPEREGYKLYGG